ncbi:MAG: nodulation protein NfeD [Proteobacteria bacterium]|nr:nodulation protein NfeD [Pseudomonadota bacterium]
MNWLSKRLINNLFWVLLLIFSFEDNLQASVLKLNIKGPITPPIEDYIDIGFDHAQEKKADLILIILDTPGGLEKTMRSITEKILSSKIPVCIYVYPNGARAASAGAIIALSAHILAMAPGTNIGASHPLSIFGEIKDKTLEMKIINDLKAYTRSIAQTRGKDSQIAEDFVEKSLSLSANEAKEKGIADLVVNDIDSLLSQLNGVSYRHLSKTYFIQLGETKIEEYEMPLFIKISNFLSQPNLAYLFLIFGLLLIFFELSNPGLYVPALTGILLILLSFYGFHLLSANLVGILLIILAMVLLIAEIYITSFGILGLSGIISLILGNIMLYKSLGGAIRFSPMYMIVIILVAIVISLLIFYFIVKAQLKKPLEGLDALIGEEGDCIKKLDNYKGKVFVHGEIWNAEFLNEVREGERIKVVGIKKNTLLVEKI